MKVWDRAECARRFGADAGARLAGAVHWPGAASLHPKKLVRWLLHRAQEQGAVVVPRVRVRSVASSTAGEHRFTLSTSAGELRCDVCVLATNARTARLVPELSQQIVPVRGQALVTHPMAPPRRLPCNVGDRAGYAIQRPDGRIVAGGFRHLAERWGREVGLDADAEVREVVCGGIRGWLEETFPALRGVAVDSHWSGTMGFSADGLPWVGPLPPVASVFPDHDALPQRAAGGSERKCPFHDPRASSEQDWSSTRLFVCAGFSGHGMAHAFLAGRSVALLAAGRSAPMLPRCFLPAARERADWAAAAVGAGSGPGIKAKL